jgi:hypothetical protein
VSQNGRGAWLLTDMMGREVAAYAGRVPARLKVGRRWRSLCAKGTRAPAYASKRRLAHPAGRFGSLVFALKEQVGTGEIGRREPRFARRALDLGNTESERLPIVSFGIRHPPRLVHSNYVVALLSDLFGIQACSGCFCAGP